MHVRTYVHTNVRPFWKLTLLQPPTHNYIHLLKTFPKIHNELFNPRTYSNIPTDIYRASQFPCDAVDTCGHTQQQTMNLVVWNLFTTAIACSCCISVGSAFRSKTADHKHFVHVGPTINIVFLATHHNKRYFSLFVYYIIIIIILYTYIHQKKSCTDRRTTVSSIPFNCHKALHSSLHANHRTAPFTEQSLLNASTLSFQFTPVD